MNQRSIVLAVVVSQRGNANAHGGVPLVVPRAAARHEHVGVEIGKLDPRLCQRSGRPAATRHGSCQSRRSAFCRCRSESRQVLTHEGTHPRASRHVSTSHVGRLVAVDAQAQSRHTQRGLRWARCLTAASTRGSSMGQPNWRPTRRLLLVASVAGLPSAHAARQCADLPRSGGKEAPGVCVKVALLVQHRGHSLRRQDRGTAHGEGLSDAFRPLLQPAFADALPSSWQPDRRWLGR